MSTLDRQMYSYIVEDFHLVAEDSMRQLYAMLRKAARATRFEIISGALFLTVLTVYVLTLDMYSPYILICGASCIMAAVALLFAERHMLRTLQALSSLIGNALIISIF